MAPELETPAQVDIGAYKWGFHDEEKPVFKTRRAAVSSLIDVLKTLKATAAKKELASWIADIKTGPLKDNLVWLEELDAEPLRQSATEDKLAAIEKHCPAIITAAGEAGKDG